MIETQNTKIPEITTSLRVHKHYKSQERNLTKALSLETKTYLISSNKNLQIVRNKKVLVQVNHLQENNPVLYDFAFIENYWYFHFYELGIIRISEFHKLQEAWKKEKWLTLKGSMFIGKTFKPCLKGQALIINEEDEKLSLLKLNDSEKCNPEKDIFPINLDIFGELISDFKIMGEEEDKLLALSSGQLKIFIHQLNLEGRPSSEELKEYEIPRTDTIDCFEWAHSLYVAPGEEYIGVATQNKGSDARLIILSLTKDNELTVKSVFEINNGRNEKKPTIFMDFCFYAWKNEFLVISAVIEAEDKIESLIRTLVFNSKTGEIEEIRKLQEAVPCLQQRNPLTRNRNKICCHDSSGNWMSVAYNIN